MCRYGLPEERATRRAVAPTNRTIVTAAPSHLSARYQNEVVYRSAERLIASQARPRTRRVRERVLWFTLGATCALALAAGWSYLSERESEGVERGLTPDGSAEQTRVNRRYLTWKQPDAGSATHATTADNGDVSPASRAHVGTTPETVAVNAGAAARKPTARSLAPHAETQHTAATSTASAILTSVTTRVQLRGDMRSSNGGSLTIEFDLRLSPGRLGGTIAGSAITTEASGSTSTFHVAGNWVNRTFTLREVDAKGRELSAPVVTFVVEFPEQGLEEITGYWSRGAGQSGTLALRPVVMF